MKMEWYPIFRLFFFIFGLGSALLGLSGVKATCVRIENDDLIEYSCNGGSIEDLQQIPNEVSKIRISHMTIKLLAESLFSRFGRNIIILSCSHCMISDIEDNSLHKLANLQQLILDNNQLTEVRGIWFEGLSFLTYLDFNYNRIEHVDGELFRNAPELIDIRLSGNLLGCLDIKSMANLQNLKRIFLNENPNFGCPNAMSKFLKERQIDFEVDYYWNDFQEDRIQVPGSVIEVSQFKSKFDDENHFIQKNKSIIVQQPDFNPENQHALETTLNSFTTNILKLNNSTTQRSQEKYQSVIPVTTRSHVPEGFTLQASSLTPVVIKNIQHKYLDNYRKTQEDEMVRNINEKALFSFTNNSSLIKEKQIANSTTSPNIFVDFYSDKPVYSRASRGPKNPKLFYRLLLGIIFIAAVYS